ncbi:hypothetical protein LZ31DRAFT_609170 [Colletotrichum somersetense]|nr:hypothetical protein LZ31DRAFT_609170 [Colletotrichum somersetense]
MNRQYRQMVEMLFRKGYLTAVIATVTLALGLNMRCKTVFFAGDSIFLTELNYRQAAGRSGRCGFDLLGNVVFHGIPEHRVKGISSKRLPDLRELLRSHNEETLDIFKTYVHIFFKQHLYHTSENKLPFTNTRVGPIPTEQNVDVNPEQQKGKSSGLVSTASGLQTKVNSKREHKVVADSFHPNLQSNNKKFGTLGDDVFAEQFVLTGSLLETTGLFVVKMG